ncbi:hypothetical protein TNCV_2216761 [Trichonephila clavipes]|nr:hypothetical protein TNCV_2216761 [Trichonephila clavipes]
MMTSAHTVCESVCEYSLHGSTELHSRGNHALALECLRFHMPFGYSCDSRLQGVGAPAGQLKATKRSHFACSVVIHVQMQLYPIRITSFYIAFYVIEQGWRTIGTHAIDATRHNILGTPLIKT